MTARSESLNSDDAPSEASTSAEATGSSPRPEPLAVHVAASHGLDAMENAPGDKHRVAAIEAKVNSALVEQSKLFHKPHQPPYGAGDEGGKPAPLALVPELSALSRAGSNAPSANSSGRSAGSGVDFLDRLARAESQPVTPTG